MKVREGRGRRSEGEVVKGQAVEYALMALPTGRISTTTIKGKVEAILMARLQTRLGIPTTVVPIVILPSAPVITVPALMPRLALTDTNPVEYEAESEVDHE